MKRDELTMSFQWKTSTGGITVMDSPAKQVYDGGRGPNITKSGGGHRYSIKTRGWDVDVAVVFQRMRGRRTSIQVCLP